VVDRSHLFSALLPSELSALKTLPWQTVPLASKPSPETVFAEFSEAAGLAAITGALPYTETRYQAQETLGQGEWQAIGTSDLAQFLNQNIALRFAYRSALQKADMPVIGMPENTRIIEVASEIAGLEPANFAVFVACLAAQSGRVLLCEIDTRNQFVFPLLSLADQPPVLTENLQKPSTFKADLAKCLTKLDKNLNYLNIQASSLRPFSDEELANIFAHLENDFDTIVCYSGRQESAWLSRNAAVTYSLVAKNAASELAALARHESLHTVFLHTGERGELPVLTEEFANKQPLEFWTVAPALKSMRSHVARHLDARRLIIGTQTDNRHEMSAFSGATLYNRYAAKSDADFDSTVKALQKRLKPVYPKRSFFSPRSILGHVATLPAQPISTVLELNREPRIVSWPWSRELRAHSIFPAGIIESDDWHGLKISPLTSQGFAKLTRLLPRSGLTSSYLGKKTHLKDPNALGAILEQMQL